MRLAAVGDNCMDVYEKEGKAFPGGNPVNVAVYFVRLGGEASYTGVVGSDHYGLLMKEAISAKGVDTSHVRTEEGSTAITYVEMVDGERILGDYEEGVQAKFCLRPEEVDFLREHDLVVTGLWGNVHGNLAEIRRRGVQTAFDAATRPGDEAAQIAAAASDYFFFAWDEGDGMELRMLLSALQSCGPRVVIATLGAQGSLAFDGQQYVKYGIVPCPVVDTMGAGDSYIAGFLKGILEEKTIEECMRLGAENAAVTLGYEGAW